MKFTVGVFVALAMTANLSARCLGAIQSTGVDKSNSVSMFGPSVSEVVAAGGSYAGIGSKDDGTVVGTGGRDVLVTTATVLDGLNGTGEAVTISMAWRARVMTYIEEVLISDVVRVNFDKYYSGGAPGRNRTDAYVLQMTYEPSLLLLGDEPHLAYLDYGPDGTLGTADDFWDDAYLGNLGGPYTHQYILGAYDSASYFHLGYEGWDAANKVVWAVVNYDGQFAVNPEPHSIALWSMLALAWVGMARYRHRRTTASR